MVGFWRVASEEALEPTLQADRVGYLSVACHTIWKTSGLRTCSLRSVLSNSSTKLVELTIIPAIVTSLHI